MKKSLFRAVACAASAFIIASTMAVTASAAVTEDVGVYVRGVRFEKDKCLIVDSVTRVPFRTFCEAAAGEEVCVSWDGKTETATAEWKGMKVTARAGDAYITANGRAIFCGVENYIVDGTMMVAIRPIAKAFGVDVGWNGKMMRVSVSGAAETILSGDEFYDQRELFWLSRIISAESRGEPLLGKLAVGSVVYNRVDSPMYPDNLYDVIFDMSAGVQFTPAYTGSIYKEPTEESVVAAKICMEGYRVRPDIYFFCTETIRYTSWAGRNRPYAMTIGRHAFFS